MTIHDKTPLRRCGGIVRYGRGREERWYRDRFRRGWPASRDGSTLAPRFESRLPCKLCGGAHAYQLTAPDEGAEGTACSAERTKRHPCVGCDYTGQTVAFCLDCGEWLPGCGCFDGAAVYRVYACPGCQTMRRPNKPCPSCGDERRLALVAGRILYPGIDLEEAFPGGAS